MSLFSNFTRNTDSQSVEQKGKENSVESSQGSLSGYIQDSLESLKVPERLQEGVSASKAYVASWLERADYFSEDRIRQVLDPLVEKVELYGKKGGKVVDTVYQSAIETEKKLLELIGREDLIGDEKSGSMLERTLKQLRQALHGGVVYSVNAIEKSIDYVGSKILGGDLYHSLKQTVMGYAGRIGAVISNGIQSVFDAIFKREKKEEEKKLNDKQRKNSSDVAYATDLSEAKQAKEIVSDLVQELKFFKSAEDGYLSKNILDREEDGILRNRPDAIRQELTHISRPVFDPFPSQHVREEKEKQDRKVKTA